MSTEDTRIAPPPPPPPRLNDAYLISSGGDPGPSAAARPFVHDRPFFRPPAFRQVAYGGGGSEEEEDDDVDGDEEEVDGGDDVAIVGVNDGKNAKGSSNNVGSNREAMLKECITLQIGHDSGDARVIQSDNIQQGRVHEYENRVMIAEPSGNLYYPQYNHGQEGSESGQKGFVVDNECGFSGRKNSSYSSGPRESLRAILSDPVTGALMDDAVILPCGHSFGSCGIQHVLRMRACYTCSQPVSQESVSPNLSLRAAVKAFRREEELQVSRSTKRRRERFEQDKGSYGDLMPMYHPSSRGFQFPFAVTDRVIIKGNKRTPQRFVGREAIVTTQCLNGWYVVKTLDNAESVKLQYRSLAKVSDHTPSSNLASSKMPANWL